MAKESNMYSDPKPWPPTDAGVKSSEDGKRSYRGDFTQVTVQDFGWFSDCIERLDSLPAYMAKEAKFGAEYAYGMAVRLLKNCPASQTHARDRVLDVSIGLLDTLCAKKLPKSEAADRDKMAFDFICCMLEYASVGERKNLEKIVDTSLRAWDSVSNEKYMEGANRTRKNDIGQMLCKYTRQDPDLWDAVVAKTGRQYWWAIPDYHWIVPNDREKQALAL